MLSDDYTALIGDIRQRIRSAQYEALKAVNKELIALYWDIGRMIVERQQNDTWGMSVVKQLASDLQKDFPGLQGFSARNIWNMRGFYLAYSGNEKLQPLAAEIIGVAAYQIVSSLPKEYQGQLPAPEQIAKLLKDFT